MNNQEIAEIFDHISKILSIKGENPFKVRAYSKAAQVIENLTYQLSSFEDKSEIAEVPSIGEGIAKKVIELIETGKLKYYDDLKKSEYAPLTGFLDIPGVGPKHAKLIYDELGIKNIDALRKAAEQGKLRGLHGLGKKVEQNILQGIRQMQKYKERLPLGFIYLRARNILEKMKEIKDIQEITLAGSLRRMRDTVADVDILVSAKDSENIMKSFVELPQTRKIIARGNKKSSIMTKDGFQVDLRVVPQESFGAALHYFTGSKAHNVRIRSLGVQKELRINEYGVFKDDSRIAGKNEEEVFHAVDLPFIPPELREDQGEIEAAQKGKLPALIDLYDIRGDLHVHTNWSDGGHSIEEMAQAATERGYQYLAICDHSPTLGVTGGLTADRLLNQISEIGRLNEGTAGLKILAGIEVDIGAQGELDLDDNVLEKLDLVVGAVHTKFNQGEDEMTSRIIKAIENPNVDIIAHPTGRLIGKRQPYSLNMDKVMDACKVNKKILELNAYPERLDLSDINCRKAKEKGIKIVISTDAHLKAHLDWIKFGVATARRGWIEPADVINTQPLSELLDLMKR